jgi:hypothetical protein
VYILAVPLLLANRVRINTFALAARLPAMHGVREYALEALVADVGV